MLREKVMNWEYYEIPAEYFDFSVVEILQSGKFTNFGTERYVAWVV
jgi:hypothetical protein